MDPICAIATAPGGAIGIVRTSGRGVIAITERLFHGARLTRAASHTVHYGRIADLDDALVTVFRAPHSYTGEDATEISLHGSPYVLRRVTELLIAEGCRMAEAGEFTKRAFLNGRMDLTQAEAVADVIAAECEAQNRVAQQQMRGQYSQRLAALRASLVNLATLLTLELDFSEEDVEFASRPELTRLITEADEEICRLTRSFRAGRALRRGTPVAIVGAPNVGKSTLLNRLLGDERAIVSPVAGTTRDLVSDTLTIHGHLFRIIDTAGLRHTTDAIERLGQERTLAAAREADIIIALATPRTPYPDITVLPHQTLIRRVNKSPTFQALTGLGLDQLLRELSDAAPRLAPEALLVTNERHYEALLAAHTALERARRGLAAGLTPDLTAEDLHLAIRHLGRILGLITSEEELHNVFRTFCIGK